MPKADFEPEDRGAIGRAGGYFSPWRDVLLGLFVVFICVASQGSLNESFAQATSKITAYHVAGEVLNAIQSHPITALGSVPGVGPLLAAIRLIRGNKLLPPAAGHHYVLPADPPAGTTGLAKYSPLDRHKMPWVQNGIRAKQQELGCS